MFKLEINSLSPIKQFSLIGQFPIEMKCAKVFTIFNGEYKSDLSNKRAISILSKISKIFERHVNKHLMNYLTKYNLIHEHQSGFRKKIAVRLHWSKLLINGCLVLIKEIL